MQANFILIIIILVDWNLVNGDEVTTTEFSSDDALSPVTDNGVTPFPSVLTTPRLKKKIQGFGDQPSGKRNDLNLVLSLLANLSDSILDRNWNGSTNGMEKQLLEDLNNFEAPYEIRKNYPYYLSGYDDEGRPIWIAEFGRMNLRKIVEEGKNLASLKMYATQSIYTILKSMRDRSTSENHVTDIISIADMDQLDVVQLVHYPTTLFGLEMARLYQPLLQRHLHVSVILNTNAVAHSVLNLVRPVFGRAFEKLEIFGTNKARYLPHILQHCPKDQIPPWYGGSKADYQPVKVFG